MYVHIALCHRAAAKLFHQLAGTIHCFQCIVRIQSLFKYRRCLGADSDSLGGLADVGSVEGCRLKKNGMYVLCDHGILAAHDAGNADCAVCVIDHQDIAVKLSLLSVQRHKGVPVVRTADNNSASVDGIEIIRMHRLAVFHHDKIGDIHQVVDGADAEVCKSSLHPARALAELYVRAYCCYVARAEVLVLDRDIHVIRGVLCSLMLHRNNRRNKGLVKGYRRFSCNSENGIAVHAVGGNLIFEIRIMKAERFDRICAESKLCLLLLRENINAILRSLRIHVSGCAKLFDSAHHADARKSAHFAGLDLNAILRQRTAVMTAGNLSAV